ncbi:MAG: hypothetical protein ACP5P9_10585 [Acidimicrobiales bacterium]
MPLVGTQNASLPLTTAHTRAPVAANLGAVVRVVVIASLLAGLLAVVGAVAPVPAWASTSSGPAETLRLGSTTLVVGQTGTLVGTGWPQRSAVQAVLCGALADDGSLDCANADAVTVAPGPDGSLEATFPVVVPPTPCPCVVLAQGKDVDYLERFAVDLVGPGGGAPPAPSSPPAVGQGPTIAVLPSAAPVGATVGVLGSGFPPGKAIQLVVCGDLGLGGAGDCAAHPTRTSATAHGELAARVTLRVPPVPCPCDLEALAPGRSPVLASLSLLGAPVSGAAPEGPLFADVVVERATVGGPVSWTSAFGASSTRRLVLVLANQGGLATGPMSLRLRVASETGASRLLVARTLATLPPGGRATYEVPVTVAAMTVGTLSLRGSVGVDGQRVSFAATVTSFPWGLVVVGAVVVLAALVAVVVALRRRRARREARREARRDGDGTPDDVPAASAAGVGASGAEDGAAGDGGNGASGAEDKEPGGDQPATRRFDRTSRSGTLDPSSPVTTSGTPKPPLRTTTSGQADRRRADDPVDT